MQIIQKKKMQLQVMFFLSLSAQFFIITEKITILKNLDIW